MKLESKVALVTGSSGGIGQASPNGQAPLGHRHPSCL